MNPDQLAELEEERDFLLRSITDLEREHTAGDVTDDDFATLRDGYTSRAAEVIRAIAEGRDALPARRPIATRSWLIGGLVAVVAVIVIGLVLRAGTTDDAASAPSSAASASFCPPQTDDVNTLLVDARSSIVADASCALDLFQRVLAQQPDNVEARTYLGWTIALDAMRAGLTGPELTRRGETALGLIDSARQLDPSYVDAQCFTAIIRFRFLGDAAGAAEPLAVCRGGQLPVEVAPLIEQLAAAIDAGAAASTAP